MAVVRPAAAAARAAAARAAAAPVTPRAKAPRRWTRARWPMREVRGHGAARGGTGMRGGARGCAGGVGSGAAWGCREVRSPRCCCVPLDRLHPLHPAHPLGPITPHTLRCRSAFGSSPPYSLPTPSRSARASRAAARPATAAWAAPLPTLPDRGRPAQSPGPSPMSHKARPTARTAGPAQAQARALCAWLGASSAAATRHAPEAAAWPPS